jgi:hypothetical protein
MATVELLLYYGLPATGRMQWSTTASTGPWTDSDLASTMPVREALDAWATAIGTAASRTVTFSWDGTSVSLSVSGGNLWLNLSDTLVDLLGFGSAVISNGSAGSGAWGIVDMLVGRTEPVEREESELSEYRGGRASAYHYGRATDIEVELSFTAAQWSDMETSPLATGHGAFKVEFANVDAYDEDDLDGTLTVYPYATVGVDHDDPNGHVRVRLQASMEDPS